MNKALISVAVLFVLAFIAVSQTLFIVDQKEQAIVLQLGQPVGETKAPGLHLKIPFVQSVRYFDRRILSVDPPPDQVVISSRNIDAVAPPAESADDAQDNDAPLPDAPAIREVTGEPIILDTFARYQIVDPLQFLKTLRTINDASSRLESILQNATRAALGKTSLRQLLSPTRTKVMTDIQTRVNQTIEKDRLGIKIVDVRIVRADLTPELRQSTVTRMKSELQKRATETRAKGEERALEIRSTAEKERTVLIAEARRDSEIMKGQGDKEAIKIYADAFNKDKEFYAFMRSMEAYKNTMANDDTRLILSPDSRFFKYFKN